MSTIKKIETVLKNKLNQMIKSLENGETAYISKGYIQHSWEASTIDIHCMKIVNKLTKLGYEHTVNSGHGCTDYTFLKKITL